MKVTIKLVNGISENNLSAKRAKKLFCMHLLQDCFILDTQFIPVTDEHTSTF